MNHLPAIESAKALHRELHIFSRTGGSLSERGALYKALIKKLDFLCAIARGGACQEPITVLDIILRLNRDAQYHAGLSQQKIPGAKDEIARQYEALGAAFLNAAEQTPH